VTNDEKERYWQELTRRFPNVPAELHFEQSKARGRSMKHGTSILACRYSADGKHILVAGGGRLPGCDSSLRIFRAPSGRETLICRAHVCGIYDIAVDPRSGFVATASEDYSVVLWNLEKQDAIFLVGGDPIVKGHVAFASSKALLAIGEIEAFEDCANSFFVIDLEKGREVFRRGLRNGKEVAGLAVSSDGKKVIVNVTNHQHSPPGVELHCHDIPTGKRLWSRQIDEKSLSRLQFLPDEKHLIASVITEDGGTYYSGACLLDATTGKIVAMRLLAGIGAAAAVAPDGATIAVAYGEVGIELLRAADLAPLKMLVQDKGYCSAQFSPDGATILAGNAHGRLQKLRTASRGFPAAPAHEITPLPQPAKYAAPREPLLALLADVRQNPDDDAPRLAIADWCNTQSDPRGEFIRLSCQLAKSKNDKGLSKRVDKLARANLEAWLGVAATLADSWSTRRGMFHLDFKPRQMLSKAMQRWMQSEAAAWVEGLTVYDLTLATLKRLAALPLQNLLCFSSPVPIKGLPLLLARLDNVCELDLGGGELGRAGARILANWPGLARLHSLSLGGTGIGSAGLKLLLASPHLGELTRLELQANDIEKSGAAALAASPSVGRLQHLDLGNNYLLDEGVGALAESPHLANLKTLRLWFTAVGTDGATALARSRHLKQLEELDLTANGSLPKTHGADELRRRFGDRLKI